MSTRAEALRQDEASLRARVEAALARVRPALQADGGNVELVGIDDGVVLVRLLGACSGCPMSALTLKGGIEASLRREVPEIVAVDTIG
jgi:Fe-S cluster biogenesis protein NfuA